jgi:hypothetical protein
MQYSTSSGLSRLHDLDKRLSLYDTLSNVLWERPEPLSLSSVLMTKFSRLGRSPAGWGRSRAWSKIHARGA